VFRRGFRLHASSCYLVGIKARRFGLGNDPEKVETGFLERSFLKKKMEWGNQKSRSGSGREKRGDC
jgi:hypothetical protein